MIVDLSYIVYHITYIKDCTKYKSFIIDYKLRYMNIIYIYIYMVYIYIYIHIYVCIYIYMCVCAFVLTKCFPYPSLLGSLSHIKGFQLTRLSNQLPTQPRSGAFRSSRDQSRSTIATWCEK